MFFKTVSDCMEDDDDLVAASAVLSLKGDDGWTIEEPRFPDLSSALQFKELACTKYALIGRRKRKSTQRYYFKCSSRCGKSPCPAALCFRVETNGEVQMATRGRHNTSNGEQGEGWYFCKRLVLEHIRDASPSEVRKILELYYPKGNPHHEALPTSEMLRNFKKSVKRSLKSHKSGMGSLWNNMHNVPRWTFGVSTRETSSEEDKSLPPGATPI